MTEKFKNNKTDMMREELNRRNVAIFEDVIPGSPLYGFLEVDRYASKSSFRAAFYYQDHGKFPEDYIEDFEKAGYTIKNPEDVAKVLINPETDYFL